MTRIKTEKPRTPKEVLISTVSGGVHPYHSAKYTRDLGTDDMTRYEIRKGDDTPCKLVSIVPIYLGDDIETLICSGTYTYCNKVKEILDK